MSVNKQNIVWPGWETVGMIGRGSFGAVYEIQRSILGDVEKAALKVISIPQNPSDIDELFGLGYDDESVIGTYQGHLKSIVAEYALMRKMNGNSNIVQCDDIQYYQHDDGIGWSVFIKMELLTPLTKALPTDIPETTVLKIAKDMCSALDLCQKHGIIHRDIKPQNIFLSPNGDFKLGDFGIAKTVEKTSSGTKIGTYRFMAPEVYNNRPYGMAADIYSLGLVLYWLLNERRMPFLPLPPVKLTAEMDEHARYRRVSGEVLPPPIHGSETLKRIVLKACAYDPTERYHSAKEMLEDLNRTTSASEPSVPDILPETEPEKNYVSDVHGKVPDTRIEEPQEVSEKLVKKVREEPERKEKPKKRTANKKAVVIALCSIVVVISLIAGFFAFRNLSNSDSPEDSNWTNIESNTFTIVALKPDGTLAVTGEKPVGYLDISKWEMITAIAVGYNHIVGLKEDGTVLVSGADTVPQHTVDSWKNIVSIAAGLDHVVGLNADGSVVAMGNQREDQCNVTSWKDITSIAAGGYRTVGVKADGTVVQTGVNSEKYDTSTWTNIESVCVTATTIVGLKADGTVVATGDNFYNQCDVSTWTNIIAVAADEYHTVGLKSDGTVIAIGSRLNDQCDVSDWTDIIDISVGTGYTLGLRSNGTILVAGELDEDKFDLPILCE